MYGYDSKFALLNSIYGPQLGTPSGDLAANGLSKMNPGGDDLTTSAPDSTGSTGHPWLDESEASHKAQAQAMGARQIGSDVATLGSNITSQKMLNDQLNKQSAQQAVQSAGTTLDTIMKMYKNRSANLAANRGLNAVAGL